MTASLSALERSVVKYAASVGMFAGISLSTLPVPRQYAQAPGVHLPTLLSRMISAASTFPFPKHLGQVISSGRSSFLKRRLKRLIDHTLGADMLNQPGIRGVRRKGWQACAILGDFMGKIQPTEQISIGWNDLQSHSCCNFLSHWPVSERKFNFCKKPPTHE